MSKKLKLSPWHSGDVKPVHVGVYEISLSGIKHNSDDETRFSYFDGIYWKGWIDKEYFYSGEDYYIPTNTSFVIHGQERAWRGILK